MNACRISRRAALRGESIDQMRAVELAESGLRSGMPAVYCSAIFWLFENYAHLSSPE